MSDVYKPIGVFDSGMGGISVLKKCIDEMPYEDFIYYGDSKNAPYGTRPLDEVREFCFDITDKLIDMGVKGIVVACNTATSAAVRLMREKYPKLPVVGIEPAIKPAALHHPGSLVLVMATEVTLKETKFEYLRQQYERVAEIVKLPCPGLMEFVERGELEGENIEKYLRDRFEGIDISRVGAIVLGCTHYPFVRNTIQKLVGDRVEIIDGSGGTAREIKRRLGVAGLLKPSKEYGTVRVINSACNEDVTLRYNGVGMITEDNPQEELLKRTISLLGMDIT